MHRVTKNLYEAIKRQDDLTDYIVNTKYEGLDLIPSSTLMSSIEYELYKMAERVYFEKRIEENPRVRSL